ncbi:hypothetical protein NM208_g3017 [Fusarium decemcellulare]|uniref:Uncharacterized protein n=1 Tax=Fusarium decemcellulare TaxID=57161 RepID=A0ACC1SQP6_9HYPO|nr:hypothetical protein NM208_g3017 [Fusarium decemcellulare]
MSVVAPSPTPLRPEVGLAKVVSEFGAGLDEKHRPIFKTWQTHSPLSESDVIRLTEEVNRDGSRLHQGSWKAFGTGLFKLLDQIQVPHQARRRLGFWLREHGRKWCLGSCENVFGGHTTVIQRERISLFPNDPELKGFMCEYLIVIVELCKTIIRFEGKRFLAQLTPGMTLEKDFKDPGQFQRSDLQHHLPLFFDNYHRTKMSSRVLGGASGEKALLMVSQVLRKAQSVSMSSPQKDREIESYIDGEIRRRTQAQDLDEENLKHIRDALAVGAQGIESVTTLGDFSHFLTRLPTGLFNSFEQALALNIQPGVPVWDSCTPARDPEAMIYRCGGGLLEIDEEDDTTDYRDRKVEEDDNDAVDDEEPLADSSPSGFPRAPNHDPLKCQQKHRHESYLFSANQADVAMGYICITALNLEHHDRRISQPKKMAVNERAPQTISAAAAQDSILAHFMMEVLQRKGNYQNTYEFDITRIIEDLFRPKPSLNSNEAQLFFGYAEAHWLTHTFQPCSNPEDEDMFHRLFAKLIRENAPGLRFPWGEDTGDSHTIMWAKDNRHLRLLYVPDSQLLGLACHGKTLKDALCRFVDLDFLDEIGVDTPLKLGASPNMGYHTGILKGITPLQLAVRRMSGQSTYNTDVLLFYRGARVGAVRCQGFDQLLTLDLTIFCEPDADRMIEDLIAPDAKIGNYFKEAWWQVATRKHVRAARLWEPSISFAEDTGWIDVRAARSSNLLTFSGEETGWVDVNRVDVICPWLFLREFLSPEESSRADRRVLESSVKTKSDSHLISRNGMTPLDLAVELSATDIARKILKAGADPHQMYRAGRHGFMDLQLPLLGAARKGSIEMVCLLLANGAA